MIACFIRPSRSPVVMIRSGIFGLEKRRILFRDLLFKEGKDVCHARLVKVADVIGFYAVFASE